MSSFNKIAKNTVYIYIQLIVSIVVGLFTTRILLTDLGEINYGIYVIVAGVVTLIGIANGTLTLSTIRFIGFSIGKNQDEEVKKTFNSSFFLHFCIGLFVLIVMELIGPYLINRVLEIPPNYLNDATILFHFITISSFVTVITVPFDAAIRSYEQFSKLSLINIFNSILNLCFVLLLQNFSNHKLAYYGFLLLMMNLIIGFIKYFFVSKYFPNCRIEIKRISSSVVKSIFGFSIWNSLTLANGMIINQSKDFFLNMFFGVRLNAANGISTSLTNQLNGFSSSISAAATPQIMQNSGSGNTDRLKLLTSTSERLTALLYAFFAIPVFFEIPYLLKLWLGSFPDISVLFIRLILINMMLEKFTFQLEIAIKSTGNIKRFTLVGFIVILQTLPITYIVLYFFPQPIFVFITSIFIATITAYVRLHFAKKQLGIEIFDYLKSGLSKVCPVVILSVLLTLIPFSFLSSGLLRFLFVFITSAISMVGFGFLLGLTDNERKGFILIFNNIKTKTIKLIKK